MSLKRGSFRLVCDHPDCDEVVDLETEDFEEAKQFKEEQPGWVTGWRTGFKQSGTTFTGRFMDYCPVHAPRTAHG